MKQAYYSLIFITLFGVAAAIASAYFSSQYSELFSTTIQETIKDKIKNENNVVILKEMLLHIQTSRAEVLQDISHVFASYSKLFAAISIICGLALFSLRKHRISKNV